VTLSKDFSVMKLHSVRAKFVVPGACHNVIVGLQSGVFRLFSRGCHLRHTARTLQGEINVRVSRGVNITDLEEQSRKTELTW